MRNTDSGVSANMGIGVSVLQVVWRLHSNIHMMSKRNVCRPCLHASVHARSCTLTRNSIGFAVASGISLSFTVIPGIFRSRQFLTQHFATEIAVKSQCIQPVNSQR